MAETKTKDDEKKKDEGSGNGTTTMRYREALNQALREEMEADEKVFIMGEDIGVFQGAVHVTQGHQLGLRQKPLARNPEKV